LFWVEFLGGIIFFVFTDWFFAFEFEECQLYQRTFFLDSNLDAKIEHSVCFRQPFHLREEPMDLYFLVNFWGKLPKNSQRII
jgi:hypothetical protein